MKKTLYEKKWQILETIRGGGQGFHDDYEWLPELYDTEEEAEAKAEEMNMRYDFTWHEVFEKFVPVMEVEV